MKRQEILYGLLRIVYLSAIGALIVLGRAYGQNVPDRTVVGNAQAVRCVNTAGTAFEACGGGSGSGDGAIQDGANSAIEATVRDYPNSNPLTVEIVDTNGDPASIGGGTQYTEDAAAPANPVGTMQACRRRDALAGETSTDGDIVAANCTDKGEVYVKHVDTIAGNVTQFGGTSVSTGAGAGGAGIPRVTVSNDSSLAANQSVNVSQINGVTPLMGAGNTGTGSERVTIASDNAPLTVRASNSNAIISCTANAKLNMTTATTTEIVAISGSTTIYICSFSILTSAAANVKFVRGTGTNCATGTTDVSSNMHFLTTMPGIARGGGMGAILFGAASGALCVTSSAAVNVDVDIAYAQF